MTRPGESRTAQRRRACKQQGPRQWRGNSSRTGVQLEDGHGDRLHGDGCGGQKCKRALAVCEKEEAPLAQ